MCVIPIVSYVSLSYRVPEFMNQLLMKRWVNLQRLVVVYWSPVFVRLFIFFIILE